MNERLYAFLHSLLGHIGRKALIILRFNLLVLIERSYLVIFRSLGNRIVFTYNSRLKTDGTGAQVQRLLGIRALAARYKFAYLHEEIATVAVHPLDPFQTFRLLSDYLVKLNFLFCLDSSSLEPNSLKYIDMPVLKFNKLLFFVLKSRLSRKLLVIRIVEPYGIIEYCSGAYRELIPLLENWDGLDREIQKNSATRIKQIVIHYRSGVGGMAVQKGEKYPREIEVRYFENIVKEIIRSIEGSYEYRITILTDAPSVDLTFFPPIDQSSSWENNPKFHDGEMQVQGKNLASSFKHLGLECTIEVGGDPIDAVATMSSADFFIMGRSSLSFVGAVLNRSGIVYSPPRFWHTPLAGWKKPKRRYRDF